MLQWMLDTNICVYLLAGRHPELKARFEAEVGRLCVSAVSLAELWFGVANSSRVAANAEALSRFAERLPVLAFGADAAEHYGDIRAVLRRAGTPVGVHDMLIGAHARAEDLTLVTNNCREFDRMPGLKVENWV